MQYVEPHHPCRFRLLRLTRSRFLQDITFECFSAFGTVGLSRGITAALDPFSKWVIIVTMFAGRVGLLTLVFTMVGNTRPRRYELPDARLPLN